MTYERNNPTVQFPHDWQTAFQMEIRRPLLQGYGVEYNRIAGPGAIPGFNQGVLIARVNADIALATFEAGVRNMVSDVETAYWELYFAYRNLDTAVQGRDSALQTWQKVHAMYVNGQMRRGLGRGPGPRTVLPLPQHGRAGPVAALPDREQAPLHDGHCRHRRAVDPPGRRSDDGQDHLRLVGGAERGHVPLGGNPRSPLAGQAAGAGIDRGQELPASAASIWTPAIAGWAWATS